ncbi:hypothetical protein EYE40_08240 [Glaciihabitans arcticus]|uniref:histidine kinase n=1 Tax=Glaciihabitans arcticus TaxID=2668039 RepID=A0A4Q9GUU6_9MICO|nr:ATP-binding protein [Glaciihabitans arcticus]TBN57388.1 hypothetical protein EYE40_08240 [Glaciihabitans arcticus]
MTAEAARIVVLPRELASGVITTAVSRAALGVAIASVLVAIPLVIDVLIDRGAADAIPFPVGCLVAILALLVLMGWRPTTFTRLLFLGAGTVLSFMYALSLAEVDDALYADAGFMFNRPLLALVLVGGGLRRPLSGFLWGALGFFCAAVVTVATPLWLGVRFVPSWATIMSLGVVSAAYLAIALIHASQQRNVPDLVKLEQDTRRLDLENQFEQRAAAIVHDTVLSDLTVVMTSSGALDERARDRLRADVATLGDTTWLRESAPAAAIESADAGLRNGLISLVSLYQWRGLTVDVADDSDHVVLFSPATSSTAGAALAACLDNVLNHSGVSTAEVVLGSTPEEVTIMVIDDGVGFDPKSISGDRLGIRTSIVQRIESLGGSVRIFSRPGHGTSVLMSIPNRPGPDA